MGKHRAAGWWGGRMRKCGEYEKERKKKASASVPSSLFRCF